MLNKLLDLERYFYIQRRTFSLLGIDVTSKINIWRRPWRTILICSCNVILMLTMGHYSLKYIAEMDKVTGALSPFLQCVLSICKVWIFIYNRQDMVSLIQRIWMMTMKANDKELKLIRKENLQETIISRFYGISVFFAASSALVIPLVIYMYTYFFNPADIAKNIENLTPFQTSYIIDPVPTLNYFLIYTWTVIGVVFVTYGSVAVDSLFCWFVYNMAAQYRILCLKIQQAALEQNEFKLEQSIRSCILSHQKMIANCEELNRIFNKIIFVEFTINCLNVCFLAYQIGRGVALENMLFLVFFLLALALQLMIYCYGGQRIQEESKAVGTEIYRSFQWYKIHARTKKLLLLALLRAQKPCKLNGYFYAVDLSLFLLVFRTAASYVRLLWSLDDA